MKSRKSPRAQRYDYTSAGGYFITICTKDRTHYFGEIDRDNSSNHPIMKLNKLGKYCDQEIQRLSDRKSVDVDEWTMPRTDYRSVPTIIYRLDHPIDTIHNRSSRDVISYVLL